MGLSSPSKAADCPFAEKADSEAPVAGCVEEDWSRIVERERDLIVQHAQDDKVEEVEYGMTTVGRGRQRRAVMANEISHGGA